MAHLIDRVHSAFDRQLQSPPIVSPLSSDAWLISKLLVHEWVANLVQHANFGGRDPEIRIQFHAHDDCVRYVVEDNSVGFDLDAYLTEHGAVAEPLPERGMGLLILSGCSQEVIYRRIAPRRNRLEFVLGSEQMAVDLGADALAA